MVAEFESDLIHLRAKERMRVAEANGRLRGRQPNDNRDAPGDSSGLRGNATLSFAFLRRPRSAGFPPARRPSNGKEYGGANEAPDRWHRPARPRFPWRRLGCSERTWTNVHVGIQRRREVVDLVPGDAQRAVFDVDVELRTGRDGRLEPRGPYVQGRPGERFIYLSWGAVDGDGHFEMFRRLKLWIGRLDEELLRRADALGYRLELRLALADERGGPVCGSGDPQRLDWRVVEA